MKTSELLKKHNFTFKKRFGQNFITDMNLLERIADAAMLGEDDVVLEIGPGAGTLTKVLAKRAGKVLAIEIDRTLIPILEEQLSEYPNVTVVNEDALKADFDQILREHYPEAKRYVMVANLPYYITTPLLFHALENSQSLSKIIVMVQKEVGQRLQASPGTKDYGALTVTAGYQADISYLFTVSKKMFSPEPDVDSAIIMFERHDERPYFAKDEALFKKIVRAAFSQRRKTFLNAIKSLDLDMEVVKKALDEAGYGVKARGEELSIAFFVQLSDLLSEK